MKSSPKKTAQADKVPFWEKFFYGAGSGSFQLSTDGVKGLANPIYNITLGLSPSLIGLVLMISRVFDAFTDPLIGKWSDDTRSRWGRRRPFIFVGAFLTAGAFILIWLVPESWAGQTERLFVFYLIAMLIFYFCATIQTVPYHTLGMEMTPDYNERTSVAGFKMMFSFGFTLLLPWIFRFAQSESFGGSTMAGMRYWSFILAGLIIVGGVLPALLVKERYYHIAKDQAKIPFWRGVKLTLQNRSFLLLVAIILCIGLGFGMVAALGPYIIYYHIFDGDTKTGQELVAVGANAYALTALFSTPLLTAFCARLGKVRMLYYVIALGIFGSLLTYFFYSKAFPYLTVLSSVLVAPQAAGFWTITTSMKADICDDDELRNGMRREGMFGAVGNWIFKITISSTFLISGLILEFSGFDAALKGNQTPETLYSMRICFAIIPAIFSVLALYLLTRYTLTGERMAEIRAALEARRAKV
jgi:glycoside/pentoside/hexuronide:cation symporter, GPH family